MSNTIDKVKEFHIAFGCPVRTVPTVPSYEERLLRIKLAAEELAELAGALGIHVDLFVEPGEKNGATYRGGRCEPDLNAAADALADIAYVNAGTALVCGIPLNACVAEVHRSNMSKLGPDGKPVLREDGKVLKGPGYTPPDLGPILARPQVLDTCEYRAAVMVEHIRCGFNWAETAQGPHFWHTAAEALRELAKGVTAPGVLETPSGAELCEMLIEAFPWHNTRQGEDYWADVAEALLGVKT